MDKYFGLSISVLGLVFLNWNIILGIVFIVLGLAIMYSYWESQKIQKKESEEKENRDEVPKHSVEESQQQTQNNSKEVANTDKSNSKERLKAEELYNKGNINARSGMFQVALSMYDQAICLDPSNPMYFNNRAATLKRLGRFQDAINQYEQIANDFPEYGKVFLSIGSTNIEIGDYESAVLAYQKFYTAFKEGKFTFNSILGGVNQEIQGDNLLQTAFLTSINYLSQRQKTLANQAFQEAITKSDKSKNSSDNINSDFAREGKKSIKSSVSSDQQIVSGKEKDELFIDLRNCENIYNSFLNNFYYHRDGIKIHLKKLPNYLNCWDCNLIFEEENISKEINIPSWDTFISVYIDSFLQDEPFYERYKSQIHSISYDLKIIMEIKASLVMFRQTSSHELFKNINFDNLIYKYVMQICDVIFYDKSETFDSFDPLVDNIINSVPPSFWDKIMADKRIPNLTDNNIGSLTSAFVMMFYTGYSDWGKNAHDSTILKTLSYLD